MGEIRKDSFLILFGKCNSVLLRIVNKYKFYLIISLLLPLYLIIRAIRPLKLIRFGSLKSYRIGHFAGDIEMYMCERDHGIQLRNSLDLFFVDPKYDFYVSNNQLLKMWKRVLRINQLAYYLNWINERMPHPAKNLKISTASADKDIHKILEKSRIHLSFTLEEKSRAQEGLNEMGIGENQEVICLVNRDQEYLTKTFPKKDWSYHIFRNTDIQKCIQTTEWLIKEGYFVIRMGKNVKEIMNIHNSKYIEYSNQGFRTELLDIYLGSHCKFFITCGTGIDAIPLVFRIPVVYVNHTYMDRTLYLNSKSITIFKKYWLKNERRFMTFREIVELGFEKTQRGEELEKIGVELIENGSDEILDVTVEMHERLNGTWDSTKEDDDLQRRYWSVFENIDLNERFPTRIGAQFLRNNRELLD